MYEHKTSTVIVFQLDMYTSPGIEASDIGQHLVVVLHIARMEGFKSLIEIAVS